MRRASWTLLVVSLVCMDASPDAAGQRPPTRRGALRTRGASGFEARWIGQDGQDWTGLGPSVGPDGLQDVHIALTRLRTPATIKAIRIEGPGKTRWESGMNPKPLSNAELIRDAKDPSRGELYFQPDGSLSGQRLKLMLAYDNNQLESVILVAGRCDAGLRIPATSLPDLNEGVLKAKWLGQDGEKPGSPGDVHVVVTGLPPSLPIVAGVLTDAVRTTWIDRGDDRGSIPVEPNPEPLLVKPRSDGQTVDLFFPPYRDESNETMTLRLIAADGRSLLVCFPGQSCDLARRAPPPEPTRVLAKPGDDLQRLVENYGTVLLTPGTYRLARPLVLNRPVTVTSDGGATILFDQASTEPPWSAAVKVHCGNTTLNGFAIRFAGPVRWNNEISWGPAVIGMTDNVDPDRGGPRVNLAFTRLDLEIPPVAAGERWVEAVRLMRLIRAKNGVIAGNFLRGGLIEFFEGPWQIVDNEFRGTRPRTFSHGVFGGHNAHDLIVRGNRARDVGLSGKTWRFLVLTGQGYADVIERNLIEGLGSLEGDTIPWSNEPEIILTESYLVKYEGKVMALSDDGRLLRTGRPQSAAGRTGDIVSLLQGPAAGEWRRVAQAIDSSTYLVDRPIPAGTNVVSIAPGFVAEVFRENHIDIRGGRKSYGFVLAGNHFGTQFVKNHVLGGESAFKLAACPTEAPMMWGWTHAPYLGGLIEANIMEDSERGGTLGVEHDPRYIKSNEGRSYMAVRVVDNVVRWSEPFLRRMATAKTVPAGLTIGYRPSHDPDELVVRAASNRLEAPTPESRVPTLVVPAANFNSRRIVNGRYRLPSAGSPAPDAGRAASNHPATSAR